mmetsp:Transcript_29267/g.93194  ORF Transcript_29267/g.93194 Transcript_29267/m.93194 type:complete len:429 (+) Transcript_29267:183-1469(+)
MSELQLTAPSQTSDEVDNSLTVAWGFEEQMRANPPFGSRWFSVRDMLYRSANALGLFYYGLVTQPLTFIRFSYRYNTLWCGGRLGGLAMTVLLPATPFLLGGLEWAKRLKKKIVPNHAEDWKLAGPGRTWFTPPKSRLASLVFDAYSPLQTYVGAFVLFGDDPTGIMHTWYDEICIKEWWVDKLDRVGAQLPRQLGAWDGAAVADVGKGIAHGKRDIVCKISDSYLGIGDHVFKRGIDFTTREDIQATLSKDPMYAGKRAVLSELVRPSSSIQISAPGFSQVHSLDILTLRTPTGVKILSVLLWTDCTGWSSHSATSGYLVDVETETIVAPTAWYAPHFAAMESAPLVGLKVDGVRAACLTAMAAHEEVLKSGQNWLTTIGWDCMMTTDGPVFFEGNVAAYRTPRRMTLTAGLSRGFRRWMRTRGRKA